MTTKSLIKLICQQKQSWIDNNNCSNNQINVFQSSGGHLSRKNLSQKWTLTNNFFSVFWLFSWLENTDRLIIACQSETTTTTTASVIFQIRLSLVIPAKSFYKYRMNTEIKLFDSGDAVLGEAFTHPHSPLKRI